MSGADEEWVTEAMSNDAMVVDLLLRLHHAPPKLEWTVRQRRSSAKKPPQRGSPVTPLSWSAAASDDSSPPIKFSTASGSKVVTINGEKTNSKRPRKKKTLAELRAEENLLLKERRDLNKELAALRLYLERQRAANRKLKRIKTELQPHLYEKPQPTSSFAQLESISGQLHRDSGVDVTLLLQPSMIACHEKEKPDSKFVLPDLNVAFDEPSSEVRN